MNPPLYAFLVTTADPLRARGVGALLRAILRAGEAGEAFPRVLVCSAYPPSSEWRMDGVEVVYWGEGEDPGYIPGLNEGMRRIMELWPEADLLVKVDDDVSVLGPEWLHELVEGRRRHPYAVLGAQLRRRDGTVQHAGGAILRGWGRLFGAHYGEVLEVDTPLVGLERPCEYVTGAFFVIPADLWARLGPFDAEPGAWEDSEYCFRARESGFEVWYLPGVLLQHDTGQEERATDPEKREAYQKRMLKAEAWFKRRYARMLYPRPRSGGPPSAP